MYNLDEVYEKLKMALDQNLTSENKDFWSIYFHFWQYIYCLNQNIEASSSLSEKIAFIDQFIEQNRDLSLIESAMVERVKVPREDIAKIDGITFSPNVETMKDLLFKERERLALLMKKVKEERAPCAKLEKKTRKRPAKQKWLRS